MKTPNPYYSQIPKGIDILVAHGPAKGFVDGKLGCTMLLEAVRQVKPKLVVSGHIHEAHGVTVCPDVGTIFVNAANASRGHGHMGWAAEVVELEGVEPKERDHP